MSIGRRIPDVDRAANIKRRKVEIRWTEGEGLRGIESGKLRSLQACEIIHQQRFVEANGHAVAGRRRLESIAVSLSQARHVNVAWSRIAMELPRRPTNFIRLLNRVSSEDAGQGEIKGKVVKRATGFDREGMQLFLRTYIPNLQRLIRCD